MGIASQFVAERKVSAVNEERELDLAVLLIILVTLGAALYLLFVVLPQAIR